VPGSVQLREALFRVFPKEMVGWYFVAPNAGKPGRYAQIVFGKA
jgi:hypothetical protein